MKLRDNPFEVMTNAREFSGHLTNIKNLVTLSPVNAEPLMVGGQQIV